MAPDDRLREAARAVVAQAPPLTQEQKDALRLAWRVPSEPEPERRAS